MKINTVKDTNAMSYEEFGKIMGKLTDKIDVYINSHNLKFDIVVPLLRSGGIPGSILAVHFQIIKILPLQFKWFYKPKNKLRQLLSVPVILQDVPSEPNILICETNTNSGDTAKAAVKVLKKLYPKCKLYYATVARVIGNPDKLAGVEEYFYGIQTDENFIATPEQIEKMQLRQGITIFPWENVEDELNDVNATDNSQL